MHILTEILCSSAEQTQLQQPLGKSLTWCYRAYPHSVERMGWRK
jgi:hypothetical protein